MGARTAAAVAAAGARQVVQGHYQETAMVARVALVARQYLERQSV